MKENILPYFDLITSLKTTREVSDFVAEIDTLMLTFFKSKRFSMKKALNSINTDFAEKIIKFFSQNNLDIDDKDAVADFFKTLKELMRELKVIKLTLAFDPSHKTIEDIHNFVKEHIGVGYILDIDIDEGILAGTVVMFNGKYKDLSLRKSLEETFKDKREEIVRMLNS